MSEFDNNQIRRLDGGLLLVFRELLRTRRASLVAKRLGLSQSAISHALTRLRDLFGDQLFVRRPHGFEPTKRALELGPKVEELIQLAGSTLSPGPAFDPLRSRRRFIMAAPEFMTALIGAPLINILKKVAPGVSFGVAHFGEDEAYKALQSGEIDIACGRFGSARPGFSTSLLYQDHYCVAARDGHPLVRGKIDAQAWHDIGHVFAWFPSETANETSGDVAALAVVPHWLTVLVMVASTDGLATCPRRLAERHADMLHLQVLDPPFKSEPITVYSLRRTGLIDAGVDWFVERVREAVHA